MKQAIEMPEVMGCAVKGCAYNVNARCHARGITIGDRQMQYLCDTEWNSKQHTHRGEGAGVGACRAVNCAHNQDFECQADGITVQLAGGKAQCGTFSMR